MECQIELRPKNCPLGWESYEIDCIECIYFEQIDALHHAITGKASCFCSKENKKHENEGE